MVNSFGEIAPEVIGNSYIVLGTVEKKIWQKGLEENGSQLSEVLKHTADFKKVLELKIESGGWYPAGKV